MICRVCFKKIYRSLAKKRKGKSEETKRGRRRRRPRGAQRRTARSVLRREPGVPHRETTSRDDTAEPSSLVLSQAGAGSSGVLRRWVGRGGRRVFCCPHLEAEAMRQRPRPGGPRAPAPHLAAHAARRAAQATGPPEAGPCHEPALPLPTTVLGLGLRRGREGSFVTDPERTWRGPETVIQRTFERRSRTPDSTRGCQCDRQLNWGH